MLYLNKNTAIWYKSNSQIARVIRETWVWENIFCPNCWNKILHYENNKPVADFYCQICNEDDELKSGKSFGKKIVDGAYFTMIERLNSMSNPNLFFLNYDEEFFIKNFVIIPKHFFIPEVIEKRKPLHKTAKRVGWIGCNILFSEIPESWKIFYIKNREIQEKQKITDDWQKTLFLREKNIEVKWWIFDIMKCIESLNKKEFYLQEIYNFEEIFKKKYPQNNFIRDKICQQLQFLRDKNYLEFLWNWHYRVL